ncbi:putative selenium metabolism hydrolase [Natranaerovirga hydrolytica]|uniref:Putative selenium metabolism hydrolase n=1 Tax=Natranaerovirga hydrolytica TaxID=680378 RepID=A0A4R1N498_9FIRM|nr:YgeY family selenium metabolism-linked hydrolase [Natranaerovirga hydrolytica]TCK97749.1 putative selenium metabolism hydrolase [Natranaerovirga hydrolytica]
MKEEKIQELINVCQRLIQIPSYSGEEDEVVKEIVDLMYSYGYDEVIVDEYGSVIGKIIGKKEGPKILLDAHIDTVVVSDSSKWTKDPFGGEIVDGKIYGRGTSDMKGALSAMIMAGSYFTEELDKDFSGEIYVAGVVHEECFEGVAARNISKKVNPDYVIIGEASELNIKCGQRGRAEIVLETFGKPAHSANPETGINAVYGASLLINGIQALPSTTHDVLGKGILELTDIISSPYPGASVVPDYCRITYDRRLLVGETQEDVLKPLNEIINKMMEENPWLDAKVSYAKGEELCHTGNTIKGTRFFPAWLYDEQSDFIDASLKGLQSIGIHANITQYSFCTNGSHYAGEAGIKTLGFGPSKENLAHTIDEYIEIEQLSGAYNGYVKIIETLTSLV